MFAISTNIIKEEKEISIFKTNIESQVEIQEVNGLLNQLVGKNKWNFDLEDIDNILRIHAGTYLNGFLMQEFHKLGFECEELF